MKEIIELIGITLGRRKTRHSKITFVNTVSQELMDKGIQVQLQQKSSLGYKITNLLIGDMNSRNILVAGYDTASAMMIPNYKYRPMNMKQNLFQEKMNILLHAALLIPAICMVFVMKNFICFSVLLKTISVLLLLVSAAMAVYGVLMPTARFNYSRNSIALSIAYACAQKNMRGCGCVFLDYAAETYIGMQQMLKYFDSDADNKTFYVLDALASGEEVFVCSTSDLAGKAKEAAKLLNARYTVLPSLENTPLSMYKHCIYVVSGTMENGQITVYGSRTKQDYKVEAERAEAIAERLAEIIS
ncbi:MAG: hypothetical protein EOM64_04885 [Erysipelotrichia bacterium]|nr:hypothetical protein [Erysipelotrichia bacterium]